jgi:hypothetical protein
MLVARRVRAEVVEDVLLLLPPRLSRPEPDDGGAVGASRKRRKEFPLLARVPAILKRAGVLALDDPDEVAGRRDADLAPA